MSISSQSILGVIAPPIATFCDRGCGCDLLVNILLTLLLLPSVIHYFYLLNVDICSSIIAMFLPPLSVF